MRSIADRMNDADLAVEFLQLGWELEGLKKCVLLAYKSPPYNKYKRYAVNEINKAIRRFKSIEKKIEKRK